MSSSYPVQEGAFGGFPTPTEVCRLTTRGQSARFQLSGQAGWEEVLVAVDGLRAGLPDDVLVIVSPGAGASLKALRLIDEADVLRLSDQLQSLVAEFRELSNRLAGQFRLYIEPVCELGDWYPDQLVEDDGETWSLYVHGEHCLFTNLLSGTEVEVHTDCPDAIDPWFLLSYAESADRYPEIRAACLEGFHDMDRMLKLAAIPLNPTVP